MKISIHATIEGQNARTRQQERVDILTVIAARHVLLTETNCVLPLRDTIKLFQLFLGNALLQRLGL